MEIDWKRAWYFISQVLSILGFAFMGIFISYFVSILIGKVFFGYDLTRIEEIIRNPVEESHQVMFLRIFQMVASIGTYAMPVFIYMKVYHFKAFSTLKLQKPFSLLQGLLVIAFAFGAIFGLALLSDFNQHIPLPESWKIAAQQMEEAEQMMINSMMFMPTTIHFLSNIFIIGLVAALSEELMFRGLLQPLFKNWTKSIHWGIIISAALFSAVHFDLNNFIPRMAIAVGFGYIFYWTGNLWITVLAHFLNNSIEVAVYYYKDTYSWCNYFIEVKYFPLTWGIAGIALALGVLYLFRQNKKDANIKDEIAES